MQHRPHWHTLICSRSGMLVAGCAWSLRLRGPPHVYDAVRMRSPCDSPIVLAVVCSQRRSHAAWRGDVPPTATGAAATSKASRGRRPPSLDAADRRADPAAGQPAVHGPPRRRQRASPDRARGVRFAPRGHRRRRSGNRRQRPLPAAANHRPLGRGATIRRPCGGCCAITATARTRDRQRVVQMLAATARRRRRCRRCAASRASIVRRSLSRLAALAIVHSARRRRRDRPRIRRSIRTSSTASWARARASPAHLAAPISGPTARSGRVGRRRGSS